MREDNDFYPVIEIGRQWQVLDLTRGYDPDAISLDPPSIGRYNEKRRNMYTTDLFGNVRYIHMGLDFWVPAGTGVRSFTDGKVLFFRNNDNAGDYGPTIVTEHKVVSAHLGKDFQKPEHPVTLYALFGHLACDSLQHISEGMVLKGGETFAAVGDHHENGGWVPHLHFQISLKRPSEPDMPGVVSDADHAEALKTWPDPQIILGRFY